MGRYFCVLPIDVADAADKGGILTGDEEVYANPAVF
jgi:hypothetical protein